MTTTADKVWWTRPGFIAATAFLLLVTILAIWITTSGSSNTTGDPTSSPLVESPTSTTDPAGSPSPPGSTVLVESDQVPVAAPDDVSWTLWHGIALPSSPAAGPTNVHDGVAEAFAHSPTGALLAASHITFRAGYGPSREVVETQFVEGPGKELALADASSPRDPSDAPQIAGFRFVSYSDDEAVVVLALRTKADSLGSIQMSLSWSGNDWRVRPTLDGDMGTRGPSMSSLAGFITWSGVV